MFKASRSPDVCTKARGIKKFFTFPLICVGGCVYIYIYIISNLL